MAPRHTTALVLVAAGLALAGAGSDPGSEPAPEGRAPTPTELVPAVEAAFPRESYAPGDAAQLVISNRARGITLQVFRSGPERTLTRADVTMKGVPVSAKVAIGSGAGRRAPWS
jgi:hypothetical protein